MYTLYCPTEMHTSCILQKARVAKKILPSFCASSSLSRSTSCIFVCVLKQQEIWGENKKLNKYLMSQHLSYNFCAPPLSISW